MTHDLDSLIKDVEAIKARNHRVELEKTREISLARKLRIAVITYILLGLYMYAIGDQRRYLNAIVPTVGFVIGSM
ncbi:hypothetical protein KBC03_01910 [Patescibacteria group bacterium]|nr:hypothetical protein [Patescibacteria group bacterium]